MSLCAKTIGSAGSHNVRNVPMNAKERMEEMGLDAQQLDYLVGMCQECFGPSDFDREVALSEEAK
jgi:hypothetical protein